MPGRLTIDQEHRSRDGCNRKKRNNEIGGYNLMHPLGGWVFLLDVTRGKGEGGIGKLLWSQLLGGCY